jgi:ribosomal protein S12 methylthiotransferase accessory factor
MSTDLELRWAPGTDLGTGEPTLVPASLVWVSYNGTPRTNPILQAGLAAGPDLGWAQEGALHELAERDTMALAWHGRRPLRFVEPPPALAALGRYGSLRTRFVEFPNDFGLVVAGALVRDESTGYLTLGTAARSAAEPALRKALAEAFQLQLFVADYDDPHGPYMRAAENPASPLKPWRADRSYRDAYRDDFADVVDYGCHLQLYLDPRAQDRFEAELAASVTGTVAWTELPSTPEPSVAVLAEALGGRVVSVDVTTPDIRPTGLRVVRVLATGLYSNSAAGLPFLGGTRLPEDGRRALPLPH